jgi:hypothetical protein
MADKKIEKALYGPSMMEVALGAVLGLVLGVVACCVYLVFKPVALVKEMPAKDKLSISMVYYLPGAESNAKSKGWQNKQKQFIAGKSITVVEDELNAWAVSVSPVAPPAPAAKPAAPGKPADAPKAPPGEGIFIPGTPNFRIVNGKLQIGFKCTLNWYGLMTDVTVQTTGTFKKSGDQVAFVPETIFLGSCPVHLLPSAAGPLVAHLIDKRKTPDEIRAAWAKLSDVTIDGSALKLTVQ